MTRQPRPADLPPAIAVRRRYRTRDLLDTPAATGLIALAGALSFVLLRLAWAARWNVTKFIRAAWPYASRGQTPRGLFVFPGNGYDGQFYYRLALDPANLHRTAFGITMDLPFRLQRIGYPILAWLASLGRPDLVPVALIAVNVLALGATGLAGGMLAADCGRHALCGLLLAGYFGFFISIGCDLTEPVAAACLVGGVLAYRRGRFWLAGLLFGYGALTRETLMIVPMAIGATRLVAVARGPARGVVRGSATGVTSSAAGVDGDPAAGVVGGSARFAATDLAWCLPVIAFGGWQLVLRAATGTFILLTSFGSNSGSGLPLRGIADAMRLNLGLLWPATGAAYIWFLELATLIAFAAVALASPRPAAAAGYERVAFVLFIIELGGLSASIWTGHADLRSVDEVYLFAVLALLSGQRRLRLLAWCAGLTVVVAAAHQALYL